MRIKMQIDDELLDYVAALSKLEIKPEEREELRKSMSEIIGYMEIMNELDTEDVEPMSHVLELTNVLREDEILPYCDRSELLMNVPSSKDGKIIVPKTVVS